MKFCDHIEYVPEEKTFYAKETITILRSGEATCSKCKSVVDLSPLAMGGQNIVTEERTVIMFENDLE